MHSNFRLLPEDIVCRITQRNNIRRANTCDPALKLLNEEITSDIHKHKQHILEGTSRCTLGSQAQHTHPLEDHTWSIQQCTSSHTQHLYNIQHQNNNHTHKYCEMFNQTIHKHSQTHKTNRSIKNKYITLHSPQLMFKRQ